MARTSHKASIRLPPEWPGNETVLSALSMLRMAGHWTPWLTEYVNAPCREQRRNYWLMRMKFYRHVYGVSADWANKQGL